jgi:hypothetical protein
MLAYFKVFEMPCFLLATTLNIIFSKRNMYQSILFYQFFFYLCYLTNIFFLNGVNKQKWEDFH